MHDSSGIRGIDKVSYLSRLLIGKAARVILCLPMSESKILNEMST